jgi:hypothetical protein
MPTNWSIVDTADINYDKNMHDVDGLSLLSDKGALDEHMIDSI